MKFDYKNPYGHLLYDHYKKEILGPVVLHINYCDDDGDEYQDEEYPYLILLRTIPRDVIEEYNIHFDTLYLSEEGIAEGTYFRIINNDYIPIKEEGG